MKCCKFAPYQYGIVIICGTNNGSISIHELQKNTQKWNSYLMENVHLNGINGIDWAPATPPIDLEDEDNDDDDLNMEEEIKNIEPMKFISCGNDFKINIYRSDKNIIDSFVKEKSIDLGENNIPRDIAFLHFIGYTELTFACGLDNGKCQIYKKYEGDWRNTFTINVGQKILKICWSTCGTYLGVSTKKINENDNNPVKFYRQNMDETWIEIK